MTGLRVTAAGDSALLLELPASIDPETSGGVLALSAAVRARCGSVIREAVVGYCSLTVYFNPAAIDAAWLEGEILAVGRDLAELSPVTGALIDVPVCYGEDLGPDLGEVAMAAGLSEADVVALHSGTTYRVYVVGFMPGFAYMAHLDPRLALARRAAPRHTVPAGSVAIAAGQTGIYPTESPGGWHLIGRTRIKPFDAGRDAPFLFRPGDQVRFHPVTRREFDRLG